ncbi:MAG: glycosyltransferase family 1 protein [Ancrocorticia sp.]|uniref:glycosyltransferase family 1 protein n=1 Tax=Ancrocorticia sp. TaxID=2593684 RepID=UPI003F937812
MHVFIKRDSTIITEDGHVAGKDAGPTLVRRFLRLFPGATLVGPAPRRCEGFDVVPLEFIDPEDSVIINMDVLDSVDVWRTVFHASGGTVQPQIMNFVWWPVRDIEHRVEKQMFALSCALFPTFASSHRTASEVREIVSKRTTSDISAQAKLAWVNLGFRVDHVQPRNEPDVPVVLYPAIYLTSTKRPDMFRQIVEKVRARTPLRAEMRLHETHLVSEKAMSFSRLNWVWVGPLTAERTSYYEALARTRAFLATATEEAYGMAYVEAMGSGVIGVFPDLPWARALLPEDYPYLYSSADEAQDMLFRALTDPQSCHAELDAAAGGSFATWINEHHSDDAFDREIVSRVNEWFEH